MKAIPAAFALLLCMMANQSFAQQAEPVPVIIVSGNGTAEAAPDLATISLGIQAQAKTAREAQESASKTAQAIIAAVVAQGIERRMIQTTALNLYPVYENRQDDARPPTVVAYRAQNSIHVRVTDLAKVGPVVDASVAAGANQVDSINFGLVSDTAARQQALKAAVAEARAKAEAIASALGLRLTEVHEVTEGGQAPGPVPMYRMDAAAAGGTPVMPGEVSVVANVTIKFRFVKA